MLPALDKIEFKKFSWHFLSDNGEPEVRWLRDNFDFAQPDLLAVATPPLRPKAEFRKDYIFIILLFPVYNRKTGQVYPVELDVFLQRDNLVTVAKSELASLRDFWQRVSSTQALRLKLGGGSPLGLLLEILTELELGIFPMLNHVAWDIDNLDNQLFIGRERELINKILSIRRNIVDFRKSMQSHRNVLLDLKDGYRQYDKGEKEEVINSRINKLVNYSSDIWEQLQNHKGTIDAIAQTNESLITFRINDIMKTLTIFAVIVFPLTLLAAIFGMNILDGMPFLNSRWGFWKIIAIMVAATLLMYYHFKKRRWL